MGIRNVSDIPFRMVGDDGKLYLFPAQKTLLLTKSKAKTLTVTNCHTGMDKNLEISAEELFGR